MRARHSRLPQLFFIFLALIVTLGLVGYSFIANLLSPINPASAQSVTFVINKGETVTQIGDKLVQAGLIRSPLAFRLAVYLDNLGSKLQAGEYVLSPNLSAQNLAQTLTRGVSDESFTIPEGYRVEQIAQVVSQKLGLDAQAFLESAAGYEGYLFPDTYNVGKSATPSEIVTLLRSTWTQKTQTLPREPTRDEVILASIVERETLTDAEKGIVAGILKKRLAEGWALEVDATIQYLLGTSKEWWPVPLLGDRRRPSPYNTYLNQGLPPGPICNPGLASLAAVVSPVDSPYYFYLHDKDGVIHYAATNQEHNDNIRRYIQTTP